MIVRMVVAFLMAGSSLVGVPSPGQAVAMPSPESPVGADTPGPALKYETDKRVYRQGDVVQITVTNVSDVVTPIVDRVAVDGGFAVLEMRSAQGQWKSLELPAAADLHTFRSLAPGEKYEYLWQTSGYNVTPAAPGTYRIGFGPPFFTNPFEIVEK